LSKQTKRIQNAAFVRDFASIFQCPVCGSSMVVEDLTSLVCEKNHSFDFTKQGYVNLNPHAGKHKYSKDLFEARKQLMADEGFFHPLIERLSEMIHQHTKNKETLIMADMGCGEGSHLSAICELLEASYGTRVNGAGIDIAKEGIMVAAKNYSEKIWAVADLANPPFKDRQFDVILNILSPSNYAEFHRLLSTDGLVAKVVPQSGYLKELREVFFEDPDKQTYSNADIVSHFEENFQVIDRTRVSYTADIGKTALKSLIQMTPLTWAVEEEKLTSFLDRNATDITVDLEILIGSKMVDD